METRDMDRPNNTDLLLNKWLSGDITYEEELELFEIAARDPMLQEALEGFIGQKHFQSGKLPVAVMEQLYPDQVPAKTNRLRSMVWLRYVAAAIILLLALTVVFTITKNEGHLAEPVIVEIESPGPQDGERALEAINNPETLVAEIEENEETQKVAESALQASKSTEMNSVQAGTENVIYKDNTDREDELIAGAQDKEEINQKIYSEDGMETEVIALNGNTDVIDETVEGSLLLDVDSDLSVIDGSESFPSESDATALSEKENEVPEKEIALQFFDYEADEVLKREVQMEAIKEGDQPITGYEIDVKSGISPEDLTAKSGTEGTTGDLGEVDQIGLQSKASLTDAAGNGAKEAQTNMIANSVVITEYKIQKRDITHPPIADYNSLVREKYKRKAKPEVGFYQYKKYLKKATNCLMDEYQNIDYLEEAIIKFRVFNDGRIEFIELFGTDGSTCIEQISADIIQGPKWEVAEHYESIDIEVPFKVLYPYWY